MSELWAFDGWMALVESIWVGAAVVWCLFGLEVLADMLKEGVR